MSKFPGIFEGLAAPFWEREVKQLPKGGKRFDFITARTVMNRLDMVLGPENWWDEYQPISDAAILCRLTIRLPDGTTVTKADAGGKPGMADQGDDDKGGLSDAFKRAAVKFGIGRYLYGDGTAAYETPADHPTWNQLIGKSIAYWAKHEPIPDGKERVAREHRIAHALATGAIEEGHLAESTITNDDGKRDPARTWEAVKGLYETQGDWVRSFLRDYLRDKAEAAAVRVDRNEAMEEAIAN